MAANSKFKIPNARELFQSLKNSRSEWESKTPMQKWCCFYGIGRAAYGFIRIPLLNDVNHVHWLSYSVLGYAVLLIILSSNAIHYYAVQGQLEMGLPSTCLASIFLGVSTQKNASKISHSKWAKSAILGILKSVFNLFSALSYVHCLYIRETAHFTIASRF